MTLTFNIEGMAEQLGGRRAGSSWQMCCPAHEDQNPSMSVRFKADGKLLVHCHAGCEQRAVVLALQNLGLWPDKAVPLQVQTAATVKSETLDDRKRIAAALKLWSKSRPATGTPVERYLFNRGIERPPPKRIHFLADAYHRGGGRHPAMIALISQGVDDRPSGIHRTFLTPNGTAKAPIKPDKMMLGVCRGGAVRLGAMSSPLLIGEGIETTLSAMQATGLAGWAALSTSGLKTLTLPSRATDIVVLVDGDEPGRAAARYAARRWVSEGRCVRLAQAPAGKDFNDLLRLAPSQGGNHG